MNHSNDFRWNPDLSEEAARTEIVQVQFKDDPIDLYRELDVTVHELLLYKKKIEESQWQDSCIVVVWEGAHDTRSADPATERAHGRLDLSIRFGLRVRTISQAERVSMEFSGHASG